MREELNQSIPEAGVHQTDVVLPEEMSETEVFHEGVYKQIKVNAYERNQDAQDKCLKHYDCKCAVCEQYMLEIYGEVAEKLIHVHHLKPLSESKKGSEVDPIKDLRPICPNCHAVIHRRCKPPYTIEDIKDFWKRQGRMDKATVAIIVSAISVGIALFSFGWNINLKLHKV